jgi:phage terminase large subunit-like protein
VTGVFGDVDAPGFATQGPYAAWWIAKHCTHAKGQWFGQSLVFEVWARWALNELLRVDPATGLRYWRQYLEVVPRKNAKSTRLGALGYLLLCGDDEGGPEGFSAAWGEQQARNTFDAARTMHDASPYLQKMTRKYAKAITCPSNAGSWRVVSRIAETQQGTNPHFALIDEYHVHQRSDLYDAFKRGTQARRQPLIAIITTEADHRYGPLGEMQRGFVEGSGVEVEMVTPFLMMAKHHESRSLMIRWGVPWGEDADPEDPAVVRGCNPAGWLDPQRLIDEYLKAPGATEADFRRFHLNQLVEDAAGEGIPGDLWDACADADAGELVPGQDVVIGVDAGYRKDCSAVVVGGVLADGRVRVDAQIWQPPRDAGLELDLDATIGEAVRELSERFRVRRIVGDPALLVGLLQEWQGRGLPVKEYRFAWADTAPDSVRLLAAVQGKKLVHGGDSEFRRHVLNMRIKHAGASDAWRFHDHPDKKRADSDVPNDAGIALMMCAGELFRDERDAPGYAERGLLIL